MGRIDKLTKEIDRKKQEIAKYDKRILEARELHKAGRIDKDQLTKARHKYQTKIRECRAVIHRKEKARLHFEKEEKEKKNPDKKKKKR